MQPFLDRCFKSKYTSKPVSVYDFSERKDRKIVRKVSNAKIHFYLLCHVLNRPVTILGKKLVLNVRLILCVLKTLLLTVYFLNMN